MVTRRVGELNFKSRAVTVKAYVIHFAVLDSRRAEISWSAFCAARGYDLNDNTYPAINEYLDTWCGSVDEEAAFIKAGVEPY